eukprot:2980337-Alexandrium_andersonii.AAC.1
MTILWQRQWQASITTVMIVISRLIFRFRSMKYAGVRHLRQQASTVFWSFVFTAISESAKRHQAFEA